MKRICLLAFIIPLLLLGAYILVRDVPHYMADEVIIVAKSFSPDCRVRIISENTSG